MELSDLRTPGTSREVAAVAAILCAQANEKERAALPELEQRRQRLLTDMAMTDAEWTEQVGPYIAEENLQDRRFTSEVVSFDSISPNLSDWSHLSPAGQYAVLSTRAAAAPDGSYHYVADALELSQLGRLAYATACIQREPQGRMTVNPEWAACRDDIEAVDLAAAGNEIRAEKSATPAARMRMHLAILQFTARANRFRAVVAAVTADDPEAARMFSLASEIQKRWRAEATGKHRARLLRIVRKYDDARAMGIEKVPDSWLAPTLDVFRATVKDLGVAKLSRLDGDRAGADAIALLVGSVDGYLAANAVVASRIPGLSAVLDADMVRVRFRGHRTATLHLLEDAKLRLDGTLEGDPGVTAVAFDLGSPRKAKTAARTEGTVAGTETAGDRIRVTFKRETGSYIGCTAWRVSNRIDSISSTGAVTYQEDCVKRGTIRTASLPDPVDIPKSLADRIERGSVVVLHYDVPILVRRGGKLVAAFGVALR